MFFHHRDELQPDSVSLRRGGHIFRDIFPVTVVVIVLSFCLACSSLSGSSADSWSGRYFQNPDRVWAAILETLIELDYGVAVSNRQDGTIRTEPLAGEDHAGVVLSIDQMMHTHDQVSVYVKPSRGDGADSAALKTAADQFMAALNKKLQG
jgi:hypothetical protein